MSNSRRRLVAPVVLLLLAGLAAGCSSDDGGDRPAAKAPSSSTAAPSSAPRPVSPKVSVVNVVGKLPKEARDRVQRHVGKVVTAWFRAAYVGGDYPRKDFSHAFPYFTSGARDEAKHDRVLMSNAGLGTRIDGVTPKQELVWLDVLAPHRHAAAVTARFRLAFSTTGKARKQVEVRGRLFLTPGPHGWQVFGYDVAKGTPTELAHQGAHHQAHHQTHHQAHHHQGSGKKSSRHHAKGGGR